MPVASVSFFFHVSVAFSATPVDDTVISSFNPWLNIFAGAIPLAFPKLTILYLNGKGKLVEKTEEPAPQADANEE